LNEALFVHRNIEEDRVQPHNETKTILIILPYDQNHLLLAFVKDEGGTLSILIIDTVGGIMNSANVFRIDFLGL
jgi:hypothetical protein